MVELMIAVAIIGVLAALAIYSVGLLLQISKVSEAKQTVGAISRGAAAAFERESPDAQALQEGYQGSGVNHQLCGTAAAVPVQVPAARKYQPGTQNGVDFNTTNTNEGWKCLRFSMDQPMYFQYKYTHGGSPMAANNPAKCAQNGECYESAAKGNVDGRAPPFWVFARTGHVNVATGKLKAATQIYAGGAGGVGCSLAAAIDTTRMSCLGTMSGAIVFLLLVARRRRVH